MNVIRLFFEEEEKEKKVEYMKNYYLTHKKYLLS